MPGEVDVKKLANEILQAGRDCLGLHEENVRLRLEYLLRSRALGPLGIPWATYEYTGKYAVVRGRAIQHSLIRGTQEEIRSMRS